MSARNIADLSKNLDPHLLVKVLEFLGSRGKNVTEAKRMTVANTGLFRMSEELNQGNDAILGKIQNKMEKFGKNFTKAKESCETILDEFFETVNEEFRLKKLAREIEEDRKNGNLAASELYSSKKITQAAIASLYDLAFLSFDAGFYAQAADMLYLYLAIGGKKDDSKESSARWGKLVCDTLSGAYDSARDDIEVIRADQQRESTNAFSETSIVARSWLLHHSLFTYFKRVGASQIFLEHVIDFSTYNYANTIEVMAPHLVRYLAAAAILNRKRRSFLKRITKIIEQEAYNYSDEFTQFLVAIVSESDFEKANKLIRGLAAQAEDDFFLAEHKDELVNAAQMMVFDDYLKIHKTVSIPGVAEKLGMDVNKAEVWLVTLIQESKIEAEIDSVQQKITIQTAANAAAQRSVHRSVLAKLEGLSRPTN